ncbi:MULTISPECIES: UDP-N-acetylglucosamine 1-carboxyvinyltransferase [unclassified Mesorhizobium]|uniref:UDP-N-acetylglucosamine 1-carboxyvinyltransferase n=1 Tax=unclassified Mesorhizobium TaxID=325217 RepID=UPI000FCA1124|nr:MULTISPECIES: UDP-N-acetylglucosamine 1-carboxyvinyltransferase [unclassified Mesorhizobium]RUU30891.1 UDP-N-acetylglucosamine 1-carboxyvinyltransferase [Mesorhizobium sp. M6A.T.Ce.TU.016.01.1.1]RWP49941.1 MAG: UDP-N-acetylglucosamine 1-carboxyvinyltransferase [Mesorhizobium sp.]RWQ42319.1 MAG: UDP-N-acetylglucosamine 1-carboxyvinyltransferase [Mesorhizobium sp.]RWQ64437.1 MAG: UDP-N-acetylglucosamine 1-carboxyvinyltransferase [Mesorhizobium sp.]TIT39476.1 MAG: UDP-N-acetylglucosamine 1-car
MDKLRIVGGQRLLGAVTISGAKNAALPQIAAALLSPYPLELTNLPDVTDVENMLGVVRLHGAEITRSAHAATIDTSAALSKETSYDTVRRMRATVLVLGPLLARFGHARVSLPGGCAIGARPVDMHVAALAALGADIAIENGLIVASAPGGLRGARIVLSSPSVGATETAMMAATAAKGETEILNAAREPEVADLAACLNAMGARIEGAGTHRILIEGSSNWRAATHDIIPDRIEAGTYAIAAAITGGQLELTHARLEHMASVVQLLEATGVKVWPGDRGLIVSRDGPLRAVDVTTEPYPGFPTDLQAQFMALMCCADGASLLRETIFENRFMHVPELMRLGANIKLQGTMALVRGGEKLKGAQVMATDLRASVSLVLAALVCEGETVINRVYHLDRGYEQLDRKLRLCGARIERISG